MAEPDDFAVPVVDGEPRENALPVRLDDLREQLPGVEPDREITDWGRSERLEGVVDRLVYDFLYHYWFRVEVEGIENVPERGGALLVANHSGTLPSDGAMVVKAVREQHPHHRQVHLATHESLAEVPGVGMVLTKLGGIPGHPANLHRLLYDEESLVLAFPEGRAGARKPVRDRYLLRPFEDAGFVETALRARASIVPVAILGAEEASPVFARARGLRRLMRLPSLPLTPALPLPAKFRIRFLEPVCAQRHADMRGGELSNPRSLAADVRALIQENLFEMIGARQSVWLG
jgi:1-acyl-sn-glycerol-3-phosphate acyltransferase